MSESSSLATVEMRPLVAPRRRKRRRAETLSPGARVGGWRVEHELGRGGMATVYAVVHTKFGKRAALKLAHRDSGYDGTGLPRPGSTAEGQCGSINKLPPESFLREARIVNMVEHPCVADVFATGTFDGRPYVVMDRLAGTSLSELARAGRLERRDAIGVLAELCDVLAAAHAVGIVHRDLKLANVMLLGEGEARRVRLIDWGVAHLASEPDPLTGMIAGTLTYVAPEQIRGEQVSAATDVYSLAVLAYELLLGEPPFAAVEDLELLRLHLKATPPDPRKLWTACPDALAALLVQMLAKDPVDRPSLAVIAAVLSSAREELAEVTTQAPLHEPTRYQLPTEPLELPESEPPPAAPPPRGRRWLATVIGLISGVFG
jgi:serine/threonine-protein kinase